MIYTSANQLIGNTPLLELTNLAREEALQARILAKLEFLNVAGSVKDRAAKAMLDDAKMRGLIKAGSVIIEPTSGNTGIGLCAVAATEGYKCIIVMPENMSLERQRLMRAYGAQVRLSPAEKGMAGAIELAQELAYEIPDSFIPDQFSNAAYPAAHYATTAPEIWADTDGKVDIFVAGVGTGGTVSGIGRFLKEQDPKIKVVAVEPAGSPVLSGGQAGAHAIQGIGAGFIPRNVDLSVIDEIMTVADQDAIAMAKRMGRTEGFLAGISSGAALHAACLLAEKAENADKNIVVLLPDNGERYLSTGIFDE